MGPLGGGQLLFYPMSAHAGCMAARLHGSIGAWWVGRPPPGVRPLSITLPQVIADCSRPCDGIGRHGNTGNRRNGGRETGRGGGGGGRK